MGDLKSRPEGLTPEANRVWDTYYEEMKTIQTLFIKIALSGDVAALGHINMFVALCSAHAGRCLEQTQGTEQ